MVTETVAKAAGAKAVATAAVEVAAPVMVPRSERS